MCLNFPCGTVKRPGLFIFIIKSASGCTKQTTVSKFFVQTPVVFIQRLMTAGSISILLCECISTFNISVADPHLTVFN